MGAARPRATGCLKVELQMLNAFFLDIRTGRLGRLQYLGYSVLLIAVGFAASVLFVAVSDGADSIMRLDIEQFEKQLENALEGPMVIVTIVLSIVFLFADLNLGAKRLRDIGLPGWTAIVVIIAATIVFYTVFSTPGGDLFSFLSWIALLLIPTNAIKRKTTGPRED